MTSEQEKWKDSLASGWWPWAKENPIPASILATFAGIIVAGIWAPGVIPVVFGAVRDTFERLPSGPVVVCVLLVAAAVFKLNSEIKDTKKLLDECRADCLDDRTRVVEMRGEIESLGKTIGEMFDRLTQMDKRKAPTEMPGGRRKSDPRTTTAPKPKRKPARR